MDSGGHEKKLEAYFSVRAVNRTKSATLSADFAECDYASSANVVLIGLQILGAVLGVLQVALAIEMILRALRGIGALHG